MKSSQAQSISLNSLPHSSLEVMLLNIFSAWSRPADYKLFILPSDIFRPSLRTVDSIIPQTRAHYGSSTLMADSSKAGRRKNAGNFVCHQYSSCRKTILFRQNNHRVIEFWWMKEKGLVYINWWHISHTGIHNKTLEITQRFLWSGYRTYWEI